MSATRGNPKLTLRVDREVVERAHRVFPPVTGRSGGLALALRKLLHLVLDEPIPEQYGEVRRAERIDRMEEAVRLMESGEEPVENLETRMKIARLNLTKEDVDPVDRLRLQALIGRMWILQCR